MEETLAPGASVAKVARAHGVNAIPIKGPAVGMPITCIVLLAMVTRLPMHSFSTGSGGECGTRRKSNGVIRSLGPATW